MNPGNKIKPLLVLFCLAALTSFAQEKDEDEPQKFFVDGYLKNMASVTVTDSTLFDNLIHNRLNFRWYPNESVTAYVGLRNRIFYGDQPRLVNDIHDVFPMSPSYSDLIDVDNDFFDMSIIWVDERSLMMHSIIDRAYVQWTRNNLELTLGRQRVNWGTNLVWNPNDIFNAYSYFDFDYEERPAVDAIRARYYTGFASSVEVVVKAARSWDDFVAAGLWKINKGGYDIQFLGGVARKDLTLGAGWAGNLKTSGLKGELTYFIPLEEDTLTTDAFLTSVTWDYSFKNSSYIMFSMLYNSAGSLNPSSLEQAQFTSGRLTAKELSPYKYSMIFSGSYQFHPLIMGNVGMMTFPGSNTYFVYPFVTFSLVQDLDLDVIAQMFFEKPFTDNYSDTQIYYLRLKWSF